jgi:hypothetical protein
LKAVFSLNSCDATYLRHFTPAPRADPPRGWEHKHGIAACPPARKSHCVAGQIIQRAADGFQSTVQPASIERIVRGWRGRNWIRLTRPGEKRVERPVIENGDARHVVLFHISAANTKPFERVEQRQR